jgi:carotenoid cleavage dioxygenase
MNTERLLESAVAWTTRQLQKRVPYSPSNPYLEGPFAPVASEVTETQLRVSGHIPRELNGILTRIGPNPMQVENPATYHWFLGDGMVHGLRLQDGTALWYRNRWVGTDSVNRRLGRPLAAGSRRGTADVVNTNIIGHNGRLWALVEAGALPVELDSELNTIRHSYFESPLSRAFAAHPHRDPVTGEVHAICYDALYHHQVRHVVIDRQGAVTRDVSIPVRHGPMIHDCAITQRYVLIFDLPITFSYGALLRGAGFPYQWNARHPPRVGLLSRTGLASAIRWFDVDPCYVFHAANAYELDDGAVIVDVVVYPRLFDKSRQGPENTATHLERWRLDATSGHVQRHVFSDDRQEFPRFDERRTGGQYRYAYTVGLDVQHTGAQPLYQCDLDTGRVSRHDFGPSHIPSETVFVPRTEGGAENDGWLLAYVSDLRAGTSTVVILNAQDIGGEPQAVIDLPVRVPVGFHGNWIADER